MLRSLFRRLPFWVSHHRRLCVVVVLVPVVVFILRREQRRRHHWRYNFHPKASAFPMPKLGLEETTDGKLYAPAPIERYLITNARRLGLDPVIETNATTVPYVNGCDIWDGEKTTNPDDERNLVQAMQQYQKELRSYTEKMDTMGPMTDLRQQLRASNWSNVKAVCHQVTLQPEDIFTSGQYSQIEHSGFLEPLYPPFRHYPFCTDPNTNLLNLDYLVHDFGSLCRRLRPHSRLVLFDIGASLSFHRPDGDQKSPALYLDHLYRSMGFPFDHIYGFEVTPQDPVDVYERYLPREWLSAYHWINVGVSADPDSNMNPWNWILDSFTADDIVIVKLDIDTAAVEIPLVLQLLEHPSLHERIAHLYFEHHVALEDIAPWWKRSAVGTVMESMHLFASLRRKGIAAHFWV